MKIKQSNLDDLVAGISFLGSGGGGSTKYAKQIAQRQIELYGDIDLISINDLNDDDCVMGMAFVGAPLVWTEKLPSISALIRFLNSVQLLEQKKASAIFPLEIGGMNGLSPLFFANQLNLPVIDGDFLGRAFPEIQMISTNIFDVKIEKVWMSDDFGNINVIEPNSYIDLEKKARDLCIKFGSSSFLIFMFQKKEIQQAIIQKAFSKALVLGKAIKEKQYSDFNILIQGMISDFEYKVIDGFLQGNIIVENKFGDKVRVLLKNEFMEASQNDKILAKCPDIISFVSVTSGEIISSEKLSIGKNVYVLSSKGPDIWYTQKGLHILEGE